VETVIAKNGPILELYDIEGHLAYPLKGKRLLVGRGQSCDVQINNLSVSPIHAVIEVISNREIKVYDMNSRHGTFFNGEKIITEKVNFGQRFKLGNKELELRAFNKEDLLPPPLDMADTNTVSPMKAKLPASPIMPEYESRYIPRVDYPLEKDPKAEFSSYIFEDSSKLYPIFKYQVDKSSVEVIVVFQDRIFSIDYLPDRVGEYFLIGSAQKSNEIEYSYLGKDERVPLVKVTDRDVFVQDLHGYDKLFLSEKSDREGSGPYYLEQDEIIRFSKGDIQVYVRKTEAPPKVDRAPIFSRDEDIKKYFILMLFFAFSVLGPLSLIEVDENLEKEKAPERIATILYKKRPKKLTTSKDRAVDKTKKAPKKIIQKSPKQIVDKATKAKTDKNEKKVVKQKQPNKAKQGEKRATKVVKVKKATPNKGPKDVKRDKVKPAVSKTRGGQKSRNNNRKRSAAKSRSKGRVDTYKSFNFKSTVSSLVSKGGNIKSSSAAIGTESNVGLTQLSTGEPGAQLKRAKVSNNIGSLSGAARGKLDTSKGVEGLVNKKNIYTAGIPYKTVVLGGMDPDVIRQILLEHLPQFRYCYQSVLDRAKTSFNGIVKMNFIIGASGHVTKAGVDSDSNLPVKVKSCVVSVLRGIRFPEPPGGGVVEVNQPMNFHAKAK
jgi:hypothetical protein